MKSRAIRKPVLVAGVVAAVNGGAFAQTSVTLYGVVDNGFSYQTSQTSLGLTSGGRSAVKMTNGVWLGSRFGLKGAEDLGAEPKPFSRLNKALIATMARRRPAVSCSADRPLSASQMIRMVR
jgi:hypothetical protein